MSRPLLEMADIVRCPGQAFVEHSRKWINWQHRKVLLAIARCRTAALGGHRDRCTGCGHTTTISAHGNKKRLMTLAVEVFLRRFLLHLLPPGFVRIRNFGFLANRNRATLLPLCFQLLNGLAKTTPAAASSSTDQSDSLWKCPVCGGTMYVVERLSAAQLLLRSPPQPDRCAA